MEVVKPVKSYEEQLKTIKNYGVLAIVLLIISVLMLILISFTEQYIRYEKLKEEYNKEVSFNKEMIQSKKEALEKLKFAQDTWNKIQRRLS